MRDDEWAFVAPYVTLMKPEAPQHTHALREVLDACRWLARTGAPRRYLPTVYQQARHWLESECFEALVHELRMLLPALLGPIAPVASTLAP